MLNIINTSSTDILSLVLIVVKAILVCQVDTETTAKETSVEKFLPTDWPVKLSVGIFLISAGQSSPLSWYHLWAVSLGYIIKVDEFSLGARQ